MCLRKAIANIDTKLGVAGEQQHKINSQQVSGVQKMADAQCIECIDYKT